jgi:TRAP-type C4-dicarboxylate transport system substrate-binding protein
MRRTTVKPAAQTALMAATVALALAGCGGSSTDKAGGKQNRKSTVLTMANGNGTTWELEPFATAAARLSGGTLRIEFKNDWRKGTPGYETGVIGDVKAGKADLAWVGSRAFDSVGVSSFDALHAPLLIDSYPLERKTLKSPLVGEMLDGLKPLGVVGLGILPGPLRKPLGVSRLVRPEDYGGKTLAFQRSEVADQTLLALGARGAEIPSAGEIDAYDGIEQQVSAIEGNEYDTVGKYLTANVNLWPRAQVLFMNEQAFASLNDTQRRALRGAARSALPATLESEQGDQKNSTSILCRRGLSFVTASDADLAALRRAVQPVYDRIERDALTKTAIKQIQTMRSGEAAIADAPTCSNPSSSAKPKPKPEPKPKPKPKPMGTAIDGVYRMHTTAGDLREIGTPRGEINPRNYGSYEMVLDHGRFRQAQPLNSLSEGTYAVVGDRITLTFTRGSGPASNQPGEQFDYHWSLYRDQLTLRAVEGKASPKPLLAKPWRRIGNAR